MSVLGGWRLYSRGQADNAFRRVRFGVVVTAEGPSCGEGALDLEALPRGCRSYNELRTPRKQQFFRSIKTHLRATIWLTLCLFCAIAMHY